MNEIIKKTYEVGTEMTPAMSLIKRYRNNFV